MQPLRVVTCALLARCHHKLAVLLTVATVIVESMQATWACLRVFNVPLVIIQVPLMFQTACALSVTPGNLPAQVPPVVKVARGERCSQIVDRTHALGAHPENFKMNQEEQLANDAALMPHTRLRQTTLIWMKPRTASSVMH